MPFIAIGCVVLLAVFMLLAGVVVATAKPPAAAPSPTTPTPPAVVATPGATTPATVASLYVKGHRITVPTAGQSKPAGYKEIRMPAARGKVGIEESVQALAARGAGHITFNGSCNTEEKKWYINMRWPYVKWSWLGHATGSNGTKSLYARKRVVVYNPRTKKSVVTAICESGPAPWTGTSRGKSVPGWWSGYLRFDPPEYYNSKGNSIGRVAGLAPDPFHAIDAKEDDQLIYGFASDPDAKLGPVK